ncbi:endonuclease III domain-containing protein [Sulfurisphaera javensis]|uniref:Endonuclease III domain-containing protein n=1 Tax=Sulfurisphaera javensis TaxID=2049879 RepID=A0AAT9GUC1_9CREN
MCTPKEILDRLSKTYSINPIDFVAYDVCARTKDVFKTFVATILSQNSTDRATYIAYNNLEREIGISVNSILSLSDDKLRSLIRNVGLANSKARYIKNVALFFKEHKNDIYSLSCEELRKIFTSIEGVGEKTADVVLVNCFKCRVFPIDTHIRRVVTRLGILGSNPKYNDISKFFTSNLDSEQLLQVHQLLIVHGRKTCTARKPLCESCVLNYCCGYFNRMGKS